MIGFDKSVYFVSGKEVISIAGANIRAFVHSSCCDIAGLIFHGHRQYPGNKHVCSIQGKNFYLRPDNRREFLSYRNKSVLHSGSRKFFYWEETIFFGEPKDNSAATGIVGKGRKCFHKTGRELVGRLFYLACLRINAYLAEMHDKMLKFFTIHVLPLRQQSYKLNRVTSYLDSYYLVTSQKLDSCLDNT